MSHVSSDHPRESVKPPADSSERPDKPSRPMLPDGSTEYHHFLRTPQPGWWRGALAIVLIIGLFLVLQLLTTAAVGALDAATGLGLMPTDPMGLTPALMLATNIATGLMIPVAMALQRLLFGVPMRWLHSVQGRFRWRLAGGLTLVLLPVWVIYMALGYLLGPEAPGSAPALTMLAVIILTTPLQAAGEEYATRGLISRGIGSWFASPQTALVASLLGTNVIFMLAHGAGDWTLAAHFFVFGAAGTLLTWRTGGLEAAVVLHAVNNTVVLGSSALLAGGEMVFDRGAGTGGAWILIPSALMVAFTAGVWWWADRRSVARAADPARIVAMERRIADAGTEAPSRD